MTENFDFGSKLKEYRKKNKMTQVQLANLLGKSPSTIYGYETNQILPSFDTLCLISSILSADVEDLLDLHAPSISEKSIREYYLGSLRRWQERENEN